MKKDQPTTLISLPELAKILSVSTLTLSRMVNLGLPHYQITLTGGHPHRRFDLAEVLEWLRSRWAKKEARKEKQKGRATS